MAGNIGLQDEVTPRCSLKRRED